MVWVVRTANRLSSAQSQGEVDAVLVGEVEEAAFVVDAAVGDELPVEDDQAGDDQGGGEGSARLALEEGVADDVGEGLNAGAGHGDAGDLVFEGCARLGSG